MESGSYYGDFNSSVFLQEEATFEEPATQRLLDAIDSILKATWQLPKASTFA